MLKGRMQTDPYLEKSRKNQNRGGDTGKGRND